MEGIRLKGIIGIMICLTLFSINITTVVACPPDPPECSDNEDCPGECEFCNDGYCEEDDALCTGDCDECSGGSCVETNPDPCPGCQTCDGINCQDDDSKCPGLCEMCSGGVCVTDPSICTGECETCEGDICVDDDTKCFGECKVCNSGTCEDDDTLCPGDCDECSSGSCVPTNPDPCPGCKSCDGTDCQDDDTLCPGSCDECSDGSCVATSPDPCPGCQTCNGTNCQDDESKCPGNCDKCSGGSCVPISPDPCPGCKSCNGTNCQDDNNKCTICQTCSNGTCIPRTNTCDNCDNHGAYCAKTPGTYCVGDAITAGTITAPADNSNVDSNSTINLTATAGSDSDCYYYTSGDGCFTCSSSEDDTIEGDDISWSAVVEGSNPPEAAGSFPSGDWGESVQWKAPAVCSDTNVVITATWNDTGTMYPYDSSVSHSHTVKVINTGNPLDAPARSIYYIRNGVTNYALIAFEDVKWDKDLPCWCSHGTTTQGNKYTHYHNPVGIPYTPPGEPTITMDEVNAYWDWLLEKEESDWSRHRQMGSNATFERNCFGYAMDVDYWVDEDVTIVLQDDYTSISYANRTSADFYANGTSPTHAVKVLEWFQDGTLKKTIEKNKYSGAYIAEWDDDQNGGGTALSSWTYWDP